MCRDWLIHQRGGLVLLGLFQETLRSRRRRFTSRHRTRDLQHIYSTLQYCLSELYVPNQISQFTKLAVEVARHVLTLSCRFICPLYRRGSNATVTIHTCPIDL